MIAVDILQGVALILLAIVNIWQGREISRLRDRTRTLAEAVEHLLRTKGNP